MSLRMIAAISATAVLLFGIGAIAASSIMVIAGLSIGLLASLIISIKTDDPTRSMQELLIEDTRRDILAEEPVTV
jgi:hypothetical protein